MKIGMKIRGSFIITLLAVFSLSVQAHVLLTTPYVVSGPLGITAVSALHVTATNLSWTWGTNGGDDKMVITYSLGTATFSEGLDTGFTVADSAPTILNVLNMTTGAWRLTMMLANGGSTTTMATGTLTEAQRTEAYSAFTGTQVAARDYADYFLTLSGDGYLSTPLGTQPDLWAAGDM
jgi:hypothetical protein